METQFIRLNMIPSGVIPIFNISQYDVGRMLGVYVYAGIRNVNLDNYTVTVEATRSDGTAIIVGVTTNNNVGTFEVTPVMSNLANSYRAQLVITDGNSRRIASLPFIINVIRAAMNENSEAIEEDATLYQQYTDAMQGTIAEVKVDLVNEATTRAQNDNTLQTNINNEKTARQSADNALQANITAEISARQSADNAINARINNIIAPTGTAPNAAEITDARVGANGITYTTLGAAIRTQVSDLLNRLNVYKFGDYLDYDKTAFSHGFKAWLPIEWESGILSNGTEYDNAAYARTSASYYISAQTTKIINNGAYSYRYIYYDANHQYVTQSSWKTDGETITHSYPYMRLIVKLTAGGDVDLYDVISKIFIADATNTITTISEIVDSLNYLNYSHTNIIANGLYPYIDITDNVDAGTAIMLDAKYLGDDLEAAYAVGVSNGDITVLQNPISLVEPNYLTIPQSFDTIRVIFKLSQVTSNIAAKVDYFNFTKQTAANDAAFARSFTDLRGKKVSICGVSIDTYAGYIPNENISYYTDNNLHGVYKTWWYRFLKLTGGTLLVNNSWSGACASTINGVASSGAQRCLSLDDGESTPDIIILGAFIANDWANSPLGEWSWDISTPSIADDLTDEAIYAQYQSVVETYIGAMVTMIRRIMEKYPLAKIYAMDMYNYNRTGQHNPTGRNENENITIFNDALHSICTKFGVGIINLNTCGINAVNSATYTIEPTEGATHLHPNEKGHQLLCEAALKGLANG